MIRNSCIALIVLILSTTSAWSGVKNHFLEMFNGDLNVHIVVSTPEGVIKGDVLYFHGYGDNASNHAKLFSEWMRTGLRVIAFDLPSHGRTYGGEWQDLDWFTFNELGEIALAVERSTREDINRPLFLSGWSTGGLLVTRMLQTNQANQFRRDIKGVILYAPGVSVKKCVGNWLCHITNDTLTHDRNLHNRDINPASPLYRVNFAVHLLIEASQSWETILNVDIPVLVFSAGQEDRYVETNQVKDWIRHQKQNRANIKSIECPYAFHELDNELDKFGGNIVREQSAQFFSNQLSINQIELKNVSPACSVSVR